MKKRIIKTLILTITLCLCAFLTINKTYANEAEPISDSEIRSLNDYEGLENVTMLPEPESTEEKPSALKNIIDGLSNSEIKAYVIALFGKLLTDTSVFLFLAIYIIKKRSQEAINSEEHKKAMQNLSEENQKKIEELTNKYIESLDKLEKKIADIINKQNSDARQEAQKTVDTVKQVLDELKINL